MRKNYWFQRFRGNEVRLTRLGHVQRGGHPTALSRLLACRMGASSIDFLLEGRQSDMTAIQDGRIVAVDLEYASTVDKPLDEQLYNLGMRLSTWCPNARLLELFVDAVIGPFALSFIEFSKMPGGNA